MKIFDKKILKISLVAMILLTSLQSCKRWSRSGRAALKMEQPETLNDTTSITPENNPDIISPAPHLPEEKNKIPEKKIENLTPKNIISGDKSLNQLFKELQDGVFIVYASHNDGKVLQGSGFFLNADGVGITNYHVLEGYKNASIKTTDGNKYRISEILESSSSDKNDYVIFKIETRGDTFKSLPIALKKVNIGDDVFAIGSPRSLKNTLTKGIVSQFRNSINRIQIDAAIDHGSSGGPLFNMKGEVIGITTSGFRGTSLNFAVDINVIPFKKYILQSKNTALFLAHTSTTGQIIYHSYYAASYHELHEQAEWVAYKITADNINSNVRRTNDYRHDPYVTTISAHPDDYKGSGYDMGHLAPARTMAHNYTSMSESFFLSNISPQIKEFNRGIWKRLEQKVRYWSFYNDSTFVVTGPILDRPIDKIGYNNITVPRAFYKVLVSFRNGKVEGIAFLMPNKESERSIYEYATSIDYIEQITGIDFFYNMDPEIQNRIEANKDLKRWSSR